MGRQPRLLSQVQSGKTCGLILRVGVYLSEEIPLMRMALHLDKIAVGWQDSSHSPGQVGRNSQMALELRWVV